jgi:hypothetical protein
MTGEKVVTTTPEPLRQVRQRARGPLARHLAALAGTPDDASGIDDRLFAIAQHTADELPPVSYASVTALRDNAYTTVAATNSLAVAVDEAQYADGTGPCVDALRDGEVIAVPDVAAAIRWPGFREVAFRMGLRASLSVPLFAGRGTPMAILNIYGRHPDTMAPLISQVWSVFDLKPDADQGLDDLDTDNDLVAGLVDAFAVRAVIQRAIGVLMARRHCAPADAYLDLRIQAAETGASLPDAAAGLLDGLT